jgi:hypothetical protein
VADELSISLSFELSKGSTEIAERIRDLLIDVAGTHVTHLRQEIDTSETEIVLGDAGVGGWFFAINRDDTNFIEIRHAKSAPDLIRMLAGEFCLFRISPDANEPQAIADTAACELEYWLIEL